MVALATSNVKGVGPAIVAKLAMAGITTVEALAELDQRAGRVPGLKPHHVARLRLHARLYLEARRTRDLRYVDSLGPIAARKLAGAGIKTIDDLLEVDLRSTRIRGLSTAHLQKAKWAARYLE